MPQKIFKTSFITLAAKRLSSLGPKEIVSFAGSDFGATETDEAVVDSYPDLSFLSLLFKESGDNFQFENAKLVFERLNITPFQASDPRLWSYLAVKTFRPYMNNLRPLAVDNAKFYGKDPEKYILSHYLCRSSAIKDLLLHDIALLWWIPYLTVTDSSKDRYALTREVFTMMDYTRHLLPGTQGRSSALRHAVLEYVVENRDLFARSKEKKVRFVMSELNLRAGVKLFPLFPKREIKMLIESFRGKIAECKDNA